MRTRTPKHTDPFAPGLIDRFLDRHGYARVMVGGSALLVTFAVAGILAVGALCGIGVTADAIAPRVPAAIPDFGASTPAQTDHVGPVAATTPDRTPGRPRQNASVVPVVVTPSTARQLAAPSLAVGAPSAAPASPLASVLASSAPAPAARPVAPTQAPAPAATTTPTTQPAPSAGGPAPATSTPTTTTTTTTPSATPTPTPTTTDRDRDKHRCRRGWHERGKCKPRSGALAAVTPPLP